VILTVAAVPELREQAVAQWQLLPLPNSAFRRLHQADDAEEDQIRFALDAAEFVEQKYPNDPEMLTAAGVYVAASTDLFERKRRPPTLDSTPKGRAAAKAISLLRQANETGGGPTAWAAYSGILVAQATCDRLGAAGVDPEDTEAIAEVEQEIAADVGEHEMTAEHAEPILEALHSWQWADPQNGMPVAIEAYVLYALHRDSEALARWQEASDLPLAANRQAQMLREVIRLLHAMGLPELEAISAAYRAGATATIGSKEVRTCARMAVYEGRLAQMEGRADEAAALWNATVDFGRHMQESADDIISFLVGSAVGGIGASPAWCWVSDRESGVPGGPLLGGRLWYGAQHEFYAAQVGEEADAELRDRLVARMVRSDLIRNCSSGLYPFSEGFFVEFARALILPHHGVGLAGLVAVAILAHLIATLWAWRKGDDIKGPLSPRDGSVGPAWLSEALVLLGSLILYLFSLGEPAMMWVGGAMFCAGFALTVATAIRRRRLRLPRQPWRTEVRRSAPSLAAVGALFYLAVVMIAADVRPKLAREMTAREMARIIELAGDEWHNPSIPPDAWRAEYPPQPPTEEQ
jgi:hypothetical protein